MKATPADIEEILGLLAETLPRLRAASNDVEQPRLHVRGADGSWSANDILAHVRSCADVWGKSIYAMLAEDNPKVPYVHPRQWIKKTEYPDLPFHDSLQAFANQRDELLTTLRNLAFEDWSRSAVIKQRQHTVYTQALRMALHENEHCAQIEALLK